MFVLSPAAAAPRSLPMLKAAVLVLLAAVAGFPLSSLFHPGGDLPVLFRVAVAALLLTAAVRPAVALLIFAGLGPLSPVFGTLFGFSVRLNEPMALAVLTGWLLNEARRAAGSSPSVGRLPALAPGLLLAATVAASCAVQVAVAGAWLPTLDARAWDAALTSLRTYFAGPPVLDAIRRGSGLLESLGLFAAAAVLVRREPALADRLTRMLVIGVTGVAVLSVNRLLEISLRAEEPFGPSLLKFLLSSRISPVFPDVNAAGSYFALVLPFGAALGAPRGRWQWLWLVPSLLMGVAAWLTASRAAVLAIFLAPLVVFALAAYTRRRALRTRVACLLGVGAVTVAITAAALYGPQLRSTSIAHAFDFRMGLVGAALRMSAVDPLFGVGNGRFQEFVYGFSHPDLRPLIGGENAHNNYLQLLAELGLLGLGLFLATVVTSLVPGIAAVRRGARDRVLGALLVGSVGFHITCLAGHPLLIPDVAFIFFLVCGITAAHGLHVRDSVSATAPRATRWPRLVVAAVAVLLVATLPGRLTHALDHEDLESAWVGFGEWRVDAEEVRYRALPGVGRLWVPADARFVRLPVRLPEGSFTPIVLRMTMDGRAANAVRVEGRGWQWLEAVVPPPSNGRRFLPVVLSSECGGGADCTVEVGRLWLQVSPVRRTTTLQTGRRRER